jgi:hypothetical protein
MTNPSAPIPPSAEIRIGDLVLWKKGDGVFLSVTSVWPTGLTGRDANDTVHLVSRLEVTLYQPKEVHMVHAKFRVNQVTEGKSTVDGVEKKFREDIVAGAVYDPDPNGRNRSWSEATPYGELRMAICNPGAFGQFKQGQEFYLDFTPAEA